jgi:hypothetical protein
MASAEGAVRLMLALLLLLLLFVGVELAQSGMLVMSGRKLLDWLLRWGYALAAARS